jgi:hypothetical protein
MQLALRRAYGYGFAPPLNRWGMQGLGTCPDGSPEFSDGSCAETASSSPTEGIAPTSSLYSQLIAQGVAPADAYQYDPSGAIAAGVDPSTLFPLTSGAVTPGAPLTPAQLAQQQTAASAWLLQNVPVTPSGLTQAQQLATLALTAAQIASGVTAGTVQATPTSACPSGYKYSTGPCVPGAATGILPGVSNATLGLVVAAAVVLMLMGRKR